jgi:hypothetical protein
VSSRGTTLAALLIALGHPAWWLLAAAGFLVRGGIVVFLLAIVSLPSPLVLSNILGPLIVPLAFGTLLPETAVLFGAAIGVGLFWLIAGSWFAAATEVALIRDARRVAAEEGVLPAAWSPANGPSEPGGGRRASARAAAAHLLAHVPTALAIGFGSVAIVAATYRELTIPSDTGPIALRVAIAAAAPITVIVVLWLFGELLGGQAARRIALDDTSVLRSLRLAAADLVRHPVGTVLVPLFLTAILALDLAAMLAVVAIVLTEVRDRLGDALADPVASLLTVLTLGAAWVLALLVTGLIGAWRSVALSLEHGRRRDNRGIHAPPTGG